VESSPFSSSVVAVARTGKCPDLPLETFSKVVEAVYDCAIDPNHWHRTIGMVAELCGCQYGMLGVIDLENVHNELTFHVGHEEHYLRLYKAKYAALNPHVASFSLLPVGKVATSAELIDEHEFLESRFYREFLKPQGIREAIGFNVLKTRQRMGALSAHYLESQGHFDGAAVRLLSLLAPHVCRSVTISDALNLKTIKSDALEGALDALASGVYLTDREARIVYMNRAAEH
jgi:PAS domain-containing protein